ncbi:hypothetical protein GGD83_003942 [Rhodoblastus sphagnicola]|uniref:hypothetical protein n=2 Tax=Rhodoblastus sphagnicola TaxID=333368 RepID=UPI00160A17A1|nr:hypothetical protein [Rhodoblastus sphagnicola]MBB4200115.1 hypothetical protein [Rhodoblastus sphagnicola]
MNITNEFPSDHYDYHKVTARIRKAKQQKAPTKRRSAPILRSPSPSAWSRFKAALRDESKKLIAASVVILGFVVWLGSWVHAYYAQNTEAALAAACQQNEFYHASSTYCYDDRRVVHTLKPDGTTTKPGLDWRVNESALRKAEAAAAREARHSRPIEP